LNHPRHDGNSTVPDILQMTGKATGCDKDDVYPDIFPIASKAGDQCFGSTGDAGQAPLVDCQR